MPIQYRCPFRGPGTTIAQEHGCAKHPRGPCRLKWALIFCFISFVAGVFGFTNIASGARGIAKIVFFVAVAICLVVLIFGVTFGVLVF